MAKPKNTVYLVVNGACIPSTHYLVSALSLYATVAVRSPPITIRNHDKHTRNPPEKLPGLPLQLLHQRCVEETQDLIR